MDSEHNPEQYKNTDHQGFLELAVLYDRNSIEAEATALLENRSQIDGGYVGRQEYQDNARTALMEALTASGHLSEVRLTGTVEEINSQVLNRLVNGWDESLPRHEQRRRYAELCNELFIQKVTFAITAGDLPPTTEVLEISDYPEALHGTKIGYRHENKKGMVRSTSLRYNPDGSYTRVIEQISRSNGTWESTYGLFSSCGIRTISGEPDLVALNNPVLYTRQDFIEGVVDVMKMLDQHAGQGVLYGDRGARSKLHPEYKYLREESKRREEDIDAFCDNLAGLEQQLDSLLLEGMITYNEKISIFSEEIERILSVICTLDPAYAADTFGAQSEPLFNQAALLAANGHMGAAQDLISSNGHMKNDVTFCGVTISAEKAEEAGLKVNSFGQLVENGQESWRWKSGKCRVPNCPSPRPTKIGPCSVCRNCQHQSDKGVNLMKLYKPKKVRDNKLKMTSWLQAA